MKYIVDFDSKLNTGVPYSHSLSGATKALYIAKAINCIKENDSHVDIISASLPLAEKGIVKGKKYDYNEDISVKLFGSFGCKNKLLRGIRYYLLLFKIFIYLFFHIKRGEKIVVYHELKYINCFYLLKKVKKFHLIIEVEEIYGDVKNSNKTVRKELKFFNIANSYIFPTELLNKKINTKNKPYAIVHGTYSVEDQIATRREDGRIHCVYAGTFDPRKGGVTTAVNAGLFLDENYHIHILGNGTEKEQKILMEQIEKVTAQSKCRVTYDGLLSDEAYIKFIQSCDIGLSTQNPDASFNDTSFPSKVLSYMSNGLRVVSVKIKALQTSAVNDLLYYYSENSPEEIAKVIKSIDITAPYDSRERIKELDKKFTKEIKKLLGKV